MSYIGTQPVPQSLQSRQQFTGDGSTTDFATIGGVELYEDVFLNGVRLSRVDNEYSFDGTTLTITPAPANGDTVSIILRNDHSELIALPITDSQGNNVLSDSGGVVTLTADAAIIEGSSSGNLVRITQTGSGNALVVEDSTNPDSTPFIVDASGNVGIGTSSPSTLGKLAVVGGNIVANGNGVVDPEFRLSGASSGATRNYAMGTDSSQRLYWFDYTASAYRLVIDSSGNLGIGTNSPSEKLDVSGAIKVQISAAPTWDTVTRFWTEGGFGARYDGYQHRFDIGLSRTEALRIDFNGALILAGSTAQKATGTAWSNPSDQRLKSNISDYPKGTAELMQVRVREWEYNGKGGTVAGTKGLGVIADEIMTVLPNTVDNYEAKLNVDDEETAQIKKFDATEITWLLVKTTQEQQTLIESQQSQIDALTARIEALEATP